MLVRILVIGAPLEALAVRGLLEAVGVRVELLFLGHPSDLFAALGEARASDGEIILISAHGGEGGIHFGTYGSEVDTSMLRSEYLPPDCIVAHGDLGRATVILTGCCLGSSAFIAAFKRLGAGAFIAPRAYPDGADVVYFLFKFFFAHLVGKRAVPDAFELAASDGLIEKDQFVLAT